MPKTSLMINKMKTRPLSDLVRPNILNIAPYKSGRDELAAGECILLDANENPYGTYNRYPSSSQHALKARLSELKNVPINQIYIGNGSDEIIDLCFRIFCQPRIDKAITFTPTFSMYGIIATINDVDLIELSLDENFQPPPEQLLPYCDDHKVKLLLLCSPNNPTGNSFEEIQTLVDRFQGIVLVDEAYIDFSQKDSWISCLPQFPNLIVCQTFSKAWALAGARVGVAYASEQIIQLLNTVKMPYNVSELNQSAALDALADIETFEKQKAEILSETKRVTAALTTCSLIERVYATDANFIFVKVDDANRTCQSLRERGIIIRNQSKAVENCIRISIGTPAENNHLINSFIAISQTATL